VSDITHSPITEMNKALQVENERLRAALAECKRALNEIIEGAAVSECVYRINGNTDAMDRFERIGSLARRVIAEHERSVMDG